MRKKAFLSCSGGMDSTGLLVKLIAEDYEVKVVSFNYGQKHKVELKRLGLNIADLQEYFPDQLVSYQEINVVDIFSDSKSALTSDTVVPEGHYAQDNMKATVVENRNAIFSNIVFGKALAWANQTKSDVVICLGIHAGDHDVYPDCRPEFREAMEYAMKLGNWGSERVSYYTPYLEGNKQTILEDTLENCKKLNINFDNLLAHTNTCYQPDSLGRSCGKCGSCVERVEAFIAIDREDIIPYQEIWDVVKANVISVLAESK